MFTQSSSPVWNAKSAKRHKSAQKLLIVRRTHQKEILPWMWWSESVSKAKILNRICCILTSFLCFAVPGGTERPALGESWRNQPHTRVLLSRQDAQGSGADGQGGQEVEPLRKATLLASLLAPVGPTSTFTINSEGVFGTSRHWRQWDYLMADKSNQA